MLVSRVSCPEGRGCIWCGPIARVERNDDLAALEEKEMHEDAYHRARRRIAFLERALASPDTPTGLLVTREWPVLCACGEPLSPNHDDEHPGECCDCFDAPWGSL